MQSDYLVFRALSQHVAKMVQSHPQVSLQTLVVRHSNFIFFLLCWPVAKHLLVSYRGLFVDRCTSCERVLSAENHVPPAGRLWIPRAVGRLIDSDANKTDRPSLCGMQGAMDHPDGHWEPRHVTCMCSWGPWAVGRKKMPGAREACRRWLINSNV